MYVLAMEVDVRIVSAHSLKDKRHVVKSIVEGARRRFAISAAEVGGRFLTLMVPGGLEEMFFELGTLPFNAIRDPAARAAISARYDSIPVTS